MEVLHVQAEHCCQACLLLPTLFLATKFFHIIVAIFFVSLSPTSSSDSTEQKKQTGVCVRVCVWGGQALHSVCDTILKDKIVWICSHSHP